MDTTTMRIRDARRLGQMEAVLEKRITDQEGARRTQLSVRQFKRLKARVRLWGAAGILHANQAAATGFSSSWKPGWRWLCAGDRSKQDRAKKRRTRE